MSMGKILVVDDDINICELLRLYIEKEGYEVVIANDGGQAVTKFKSGYARYHAARTGRLAGVQRDTKDIAVSYYHAYCQGRGL